MDLKDLMNEIDSSKEFAVLFGNGLSNIFTNKLSFSQKEKTQEIINKFIAFGQEYVSKEKNYVRSPGHLLESFYNRLAYFVAERYIDDYKDIGFAHQEVKRLLKKFKAVYTINMDPIVYRNIFGDRSSDTGEDRKKSIFCDGFCHFEKDKWFEKEKMKKCFETSGLIPVFYLHGAFHILHKAYNEMNQDHTTGYTKIISEPHIGGKNLYEVVEEKYKELMDDKKLDVTNEESSVLISSNYFKKLHHVDHDDYKKYCFDQLLNEKKLFIFGCSFKDDHHILKKLADSESIKEIYIGYKESESDKDYDTRDNVKKAIEDLRRSKLISPHSDIETKIQYMKTDDLLMR